METLLTPSLEAVLSTTITKLAEFFGTTTEIVMTNLPIWLNKYGWYICIRGVPSLILASLFAGSLACGIIAIIKYACLANIYSSKDNKWLILVVIICILIIVGTDVIACAVSPEFYAINAIIKTN